MNTLRFALLLGLLSTLIWQSCVDLEFDAPPETALCDWQANTTIQELKAMHTFGSEQTIEEPIIISGIVVADDQSGNFYRNLVIQDETAGIEVRFGLTDLYNQFPQGRRVYVNCQGLVLSDYNGVTQIGEIQDAVLNDYICRGEKNVTVEPKQMTIAELSQEDISTLVTLTDIQFDNSSAGTTYADAVNLSSLNLILQECNTENTIILRSSGYADFAADLTPTTSGSITAIYSVFRDDQQLFIRTTADVDMTQERCGGGNGGNGGVVVETLMEDFETNAQDNLDIDIEGWSNLALKGTRVWRGKEFSGNLYAQATAFQDTNSEMDAWLITPGIKLDSPKTLRFKSQIGFAVNGHNGLSVWISTDYNGTNYASATWTQLNATVATSSSSENVWIDSGDIDLSGYSGVGYIGFKCVGSGPNGQTSSYRVDDIEVN